MEFDFGLTALGGQFHMDWRYSGTAPQELVRHWAELTACSEDGLEELRHLHEDVRLLLASPLSNDEIQALWRVAATYYPDFPVSGEDPPRGRAWLLGVDRELQPFLQESVGVVLAARAEDESAQSAVIVLAESLMPQRELPLEPLPAQFVIGAVERCAREASAALAFRFLLRAYAAYSSPVPAAVWRAFEELNHSFEYGEFMLATIEYLREE